MPAANASLLLADLLTAQNVRWAVWTGLVGLTIAVLVLMRTRWGHSQPLVKCAGLSLLAHLLVGIYSTTVHIVSSHGAPGGGQAVYVASIEADSSEPSTDAARRVAQADAWNTLPASDAREIVVPATTTAPRAEMDEAPLERRAVENMAAAHPVSPTHAAPVEIPAAQIGSRIATAARPAEAIEPLAAPQIRDSADVASTSPSAASEVPPPSTAPSSDGAFPIGKGTGEGAAQPNIQSLASHPLEPVHPSAGAAANQAVGTARVASAKTDGHGVPSIYQLRLAPDHSRIAAGHGGSLQTEAAVKAALVWLAANQSRDGRWDVAALGGGREVMVDGQNRGGAGSQADTGITGLCLLSFLASGNTHLQGDHAPVAQRGLEYLLTQQAPDGNLGGRAAVYEKMYCHAMATFALSEAFAMTADERMKSAVEKAVGYSVATQNRTTGGWRYLPGDPGDMSQLGWQLMALKSAELAGIKMPNDTRAGIVRFLQSVSSGKHGGLASYRPGHRVSRAMTAEALVCRQFLGMARENPASDEAGDFLLGGLPGAEEANLYSWYYATLGMYQLQGEHWRRWNEALQGKLLNTQRTDGALSGSWDPDRVWGAYGGRAYSTALSALCLEVYYRFLPLYVEHGARVGGK